MLFGANGKSLVYRKYKSGPKILPYGTPASISFSLENSFPCFARKNLKVMNDSRRAQYSTGRHNFSLCMRPSCQTLSNACATLRNTAEHTIPSSRDFSILNVIQWFCSIVECLFLKPNWCDEFNCFSSMIHCILWRINFSRNFENGGSSEIGLYVETIWGSFPGLEPLTTSATFQRLGKCVRRIENISEL